MENRPVCRKKWVRRREVTPPRLSAMITVREARNAPPPLTGDVLARMEAMSRDSSYDALKRVLTEIIAELARYKPREVFAAIQDLLGRLSSKDEAESEVKAQLV